MKFITTNLFLFLTLSIFGQSQITAEDLSTIVGSWEGTITYLDYQSNKPFTMPANLIVEKGKNENILVLNNLFPNEPKANNSEKIKASKNGTLLNGLLVISREEQIDGGVHIQAERSGKDANKKALIRYTYQIEKDIFVIRKEVQFNQEENWIKRSEFSYNRKE